MLVFGSYRNIPKDNKFVIFNFSSLTQVIPQLPGLYPDIYATINDEREFDTWYYDYIFNNPEAFSSLMQILMALYDYGNVYICIGEFSYDNNISVVNESFMKVLQQRYGLKYYIINNIEDLDYISYDGCDFTTVEGIQNFDHDKEQYMIYQTEGNILSSRVGEVK